MKAAHTKYEQAETLQQGVGIVTKVLLIGAQNNAGCAMFEDIVEPGSGVPRHIHLEQDETFSFLEGTFDVEVDGQFIRVSPGDVAFIPKGAVHAWKNVGGSTGRLRYILAPGFNAEEMFRAADKATKAGELDPKDVAKHFPIQKIVGPPLE
ncbi:MAG: cupin domain-containing protein [Chloroflexota bacterium]